MFCHNFKTLRIEIDCVLILVVSMSENCSQGWPIAWNNQRLCLLIFVSGKNVLTGAKVISLDSFFLFCPPGFYMLFWLDLISIVSFRILRWEMRPIQPLRTYTRYLQSSGKTSNGMLHNCNIFVKIHGAGTRLFMLNPTLIYSFLVKSFSKGYLCS